MSAETTTENIGWVDSIIQWFIDFFASIVIFVWNLIEPVLMFVTELLLNLIVLLVGIIPSFSFAENISLLGFLEDIPTEYAQWVFYAIDRTGLSTAIMLVLAAALIRMLIRFIPYIGTKVAT